MKRKNINLFIPTVTVGVAICLTVLISCENSKKLPDPEQLTPLVSQPFTASANIKFDDITAVADINKTSPQQFTLKVVQPEHLKDLTFRYNGSQIGIDYKGMSVDLNDDSLIAKGLTAIILKAVNAASEQSGVKVDTRDGALWIDGETEDGEFNLKLDKNTGSFLELNMPDLDLECEFTDFIFQTPEQTTSDPSNSAPTE